MSKPFLKYVIIIGVILILIGTGCSLDKKLTIDPGSYAVSQTREGRHAPPAPFVQGIEVDSELQEVTIYLRKGDPLRIPYQSRPQDQWPAGCPGNLYSQRMEVIDLQAGSEAASILGLTDPILVRNCPDTPYQLVLREDGEIGGSSTACPFMDECLFFTNSQNGVDQSCQDVELMLEEMDREKSDLEVWAEALVDGYGPGIWYFSATSERPLFHHSPESPTLESIAEELNELFQADQIPTIQVEGQAGETVQVSVSDDQQLTQGMGSAGAQGYLQVVLYSLASLPGIDCVDFQFQEGDHAQPGVYCRAGGSP